LAINSVRDIPGPDFDQFLSTELEFVDVDDTSTSNSAPNVHIEHIPAEPKGFTVDVPELEQYSSSSSSSGVSLVGLETDGTGHSLPTRKPLSEKCPIRRGRQIALGNNFLAVPKLKVFATRRTDWCTEYTVNFRKVKCRLGIFVKQIGTDIYIQEPDESDTLDSMCLMQVAGIEVGDILVGINGVSIKATVIL
jgi:hypothetical protein